MPRKCRYHGCDARAVECGLCLDHLVMEQAQRPLPVQRGEIEVVDVGGQQVEFKWTPTLTREKFVRMWADGWSLVYRRGDELRWSRPAGHRNGNGHHG